ncbi:hypothetical protein CRE_19536 [Caenorhabditis remanei]|uniref:Uncharacterized protein n=1 Tax=Caenorhabditis remanei TaxID=31234 RepID=E3NJ79_CAERE|nr:hypothetical protein CRE_19536 [Caenorhabditis remanei]
MALYCQYKPSKEGWDVGTFNSIHLAQRDLCWKVITEDGSNFVEELASDPKALELSRELSEKLRIAMVHFKKFPDASLPPEAHQKEVRS